MPFCGGDVSVPNISLHELMWEKILTYGSRIAIIDAFRDDLSLSYLDMYERSRTCAAYLQSIGIKKGDFISICASGCTEYIFLAIGILGCGAVLTPCNPNYRKDEILEQFAVTRPRIVFVDEDTVEKMVAVKSEMSCIEEIFVIGPSSTFLTVDQILKEGNSESLQVVDIDPENDLATAPYSSGTTGLPKCAMMTHRNYVASAILEIFPSTEIQHTIYCNRPMYHIGGFGVALSGLRIGAKVILDCDCQVPKMLKMIENYRITTIPSVASDLRQMLEAKERLMYDLSSLKWIFSGGAVHAPDLIRKVTKEFNCTLILEYGMTEVDSMSLIMISQNDPPVSAGKIRPGIQIKISDVVSGQECENGSNGEICVKSAQVTKGYLKNPVASTSSFDQDGWFRTGDIGHVTKDGQLFIVDRLKDIIMYKSTQQSGKVDLISPSELATAISKHPKVIDVGVVGIPDEIHGEVPIAFIVPSDHRVSAESMHQSLSEQILDCKLLRRVELVFTIPVSATGKMQRGVLRKLAGF